MGLLGFIKKVISGNDSKRINLENDTNAISF
jgi:hypothetical protein